MKKIIIYYPYSLREQKSGSAVRPIKMLKAFEELSDNKKVEIIAIYGESSDRATFLQRLYNEIDPNDILFCYMENSTLPFWLTDKDHIPRAPFLELSFFRYLKKHHIPIGLFYRDIYWRFKEEYPLRGIKRIVMKSIYSLELLIYKKYISHYFLPSGEMNEYVGFDPKQTSSLPPGGFIEKFEKHSQDDNQGLNVIYVGGISERYGLKEMLESVAILNNNHKSINLLLVCREKELDQFKSIITPYLEKEWLMIFHAHGEKLKGIYSRADIAIIPRQRNTYNDFAVPVKLFEYISHGLPIISTNCIAQAEIITRFELGIVTNDNSRDLANAIELFLDSKTKSRYTSNVKKALLNHHSWKHRAETVYQILGKG
ncbi:glycosyltransferase [bacterium LRH843]|nr:glycosyltransferase [bacterium LRH843]